MPLFFKKSNSLTSTIQDHQAQLLPLLLELHHTPHAKKQTIINQITKLSTKIPSLTGYPSNPTSFWNAESFMWTYKIDKDTRNQITQFLKHNLSPPNLSQPNLSQHNNSPQNLSPHNSLQHNLPQNNLSQHNSLQHNISQHNISQHNISQHNISQDNLPQNNIPQNIIPLDLGCGAYSYIPSIGFDLSPKMLDLNSNLKEKIIGNIEHPLPFHTNSHHAITAIFLLNYIEHLHPLLLEIKRILHSQGIFIVILSKTPVNKYHQMQQKQTYTKEQWHTLLNQHFNTTSHHQNDLLIYTCTSKDHQNLINQNPSLTTIN